MPSLPTPNADKFSAPNSRERDSERNLQRLREIEKDTSKLLVRREKKQAPIVMRYAHLGMEFIVVFGVIFYGGYYVDQRFGFTPWFTIIGSFLGFAAAMIRLVSAAQEIARGSDNLPPEA